MPKYLHSHSFSGSIEIRTRPEKRDKNVRNVYYNSITVSQLVPEGYIALYWRRSSYLAFGCLCVLCGATECWLAFFISLHNTEHGRRARWSESGVRSSRNGKTFIILFLSIAWFHFAFDVVNLHTPRARTLIGNMMRAEMVVCQHLLLWLRGEIFVFILKYHYYFLVFLYVI